MVIVEPRLPDRSDLVPLLAESTPVAGLAVLTNAAESKPSSRSAFRLTTLPAELVLKGGLPAPTVSASAVAPAPGVRFCSVSSGLAIVF